MSCRSFLLLITALATVGSVGAIAMSAPDLSGKRFTIQWNEANGTQTRTFLVIFVDGKPGAPVTATLLNPTEHDLESCPDHTYVGTYNANGTIEMRLSPCKGPWMNGFKLTASGTSLSGVFVGGVGGFAVTGPAIGKCENCGADSSNWTLPATIAAAAMLALWIRKKVKSQRSGAPLPSSAPEDPNDPWHDLRRTQEPPSRIILTDRPEAKPPSHIVLTDRPEAKPPSRIVLTDRPEGKPPTRTPPTRGAAPGRTPRR
jgi:hypothetical protein